MDETKELVLLLIGICLVALLSFFLIFMILGTAVDDLRATNNETPVYVSHYARNGVPVRERTVLTAVLAFLIETPEYVPSL